MPKQPTKAPRTNKRVSRKKAGPLSNEDKRLIKEWLVTKDENEIARSLRRPLHQIQKYKKLILSEAPQITVRASEAEELRRELRSHSSWDSIQLEFTDNELLIYENCYVEYRKQFKEMTPTELKQLEQLITLEVFMKRKNIDRIGYQQEVERMVKLQKKMMDGGTPTGDEAVELRELEVLIQSARAASISQTKEHTDLLKTHQGILKDLKGTREQRVKNLEQQGKFIAILKDLEINERRKSIGEVIGLTDLAVEKEKERLAKPIQFADNMIDQPILNHETYVDDDESEEEEEDDGSN